MCSCAHPGQQRELQLPSAQACLEVLLEARNDELSIKTALVAVSGRDHQHCARFCSSCGHLPRKPWKLKGYRLHWYFILYRGLQLKRF